MDDIQRNTDLFLKGMRVNMPSFDFPVQSNRTSNLIESKFITPSEAYDFFKGTRPVIHADVLALMDDFIKLKKIHGSPVEKKLYNSMTTEHLITRLFQKRCVVFYNSNDTYVLRNGMQGHGGFDLIGLEKEMKPLVLADYLSYDEIKLSALIGLSSPTCFINAGDRNNCGALGSVGSFESRGIILGLVGPRFELPGFMEYYDLAVHKDQNIPAKGFGTEKEALAARASQQSVELGKLWAQFYRIPHLPSYEEAKTDGNFLSGPCGRYLNASAYRRRIEISAETLLLEANLRAGDTKKKGYVYVVGLGLGVWCLPTFKDVLQQLYIDAFGTVLGKLKLSNLAVVAFSWINGDISKIVPRNKSLQICLTKSSPQSKLDGEHSDKILIVTYAWDGNSFPGNEYWIGALSASGDPAAACCSLIGEIQNPLINPYISGEHAKILSPERDDC